MKAVAYLSLAAWICISGTYLATLHVMNKIRIEDSMYAAVDNIRELTPIIQLLNEKEFEEAEQQISYLLDRNVRRAQTCDYAACNRETPPRVLEAIDEGRDALSSASRP